MYRIIVADDEEYVRDLLVKRINLSQTPYEVVGIASDGEEAFALVKELKPDVLITDICMPKVTGLDLIKMVNDLDLSIKTIVISGYDEFSYVKTALTLNVKDYLLKPFSQDELFTVLNKIMSEFESQANLIQNMESMQDQIEKNLVHEQERYLLQVLQNLISDDRLLEESLKVKLDIAADFYCVGVLRLPILQNKQKIDLQNYEKIEKVLEIVKDEYFNSDIKSYVINENNRHLIIILCGNYMNQMLFHKSIQDGIEKINESMERYYNMKLWCALGNAYSEWKQISESYKEAMMVWKGFLNQKDSTLLYKDQQKREQTSDITTVQRPKELEKSLLLYIQMNRKEEALEVLNEMLEYYAFFPADMMEFVSISLVDLVFTISSSLMKASGDIRVWEDEGIIEYLKRHFLHGSLMEAKVVLEEYIVKCCKHFAVINKNQSDKIVYNVKMLIEKNIDNEEFNLESASTQLFFSHNYIRQIFKQKTGEGFIEYLTRRRMETAEVLLKDPSLKIQEIANSTGYSNPRYFASSFRKYYNCTPTEYREKINK
jgi:two-component system response regulator YesN